MRAQLLPRFCCATLAVAVALLTACRQPAPSPTKRQPGSASTPAPSAPPVTAPPPRDARFAVVEPVLEAWRTAQNARSFSAYAALYGEHFRGTKRVGSQSFRFDRKRWLRDREPMFVPGLSVQVEHAEWAAVGGHIVVVFKQRFVTPAYRDSGQKLLAFALTPSGYRIVREEMLSSDVEGGGGGVPALPGFYAARPDGVVLRSNIDERWLQPTRRAQLQALRKLRVEREGDGEVEVPEEPLLTAADVVLPPEVQAMRGRRVFVWPGAAPNVTVVPPPCEATITSVELRDAAKESFEQVRYMWGTDALYGHFVFGKLDKPCPGALWASEAPGAVQFVPRAISGELRQAVVRAFEADPRARAAQAEYHASTGANDKWYEAPLGAYLLGPETAQQLLFVAGYRFTPEFERSLTLLFELAPGTKRPRALGLIDENGYVTSPRVACDFDGDGQLELLTGPSDSLENIDLIRFKAGKVTSTTVYFEPAFVCPG